jgi:hypothetical protein
MRALKWVLVGLGAVFLLPMVSLSLFIIFSSLRTPPSFDADPVLRLETWTAVAPGKERARIHNSNTDLITYKGSLILAYQQSKWHLQDKNGALVIARSNDAKNWDEVARITVPGTDVRDPKFAEINGRLFLYFLPNLNFDPMPHTTYWTVSDDGVTWTEPREILGWGGFNFWRPKTVDGETWYVMAAGNEGAERHKYGTDTPEYSHMYTVLLKSEDGIRWEKVSNVYTAHGTGEPAMEFLPNGSIISTLRCSSLGTGGYEFGNPTGNTVIATAAPPYEEWSYAHSFITRFDGATLFPLEGRVFGVGRNQLGPRFDMGNHLARKRTAFYEVKRDGLVHLFDLPSNGDTAYTGVVIRGDDIFVSYYTNPVHKDYPWIVGICIFPPSEIRMARVSAAGLLQYADQINKK